MKLLLTLLTTLAISANSLAAAAPVNPTGCASTGLLPHDAGQTAHHCRL